MGSYNITEVIKSDVKFCCKVSFNGKKSEYYEMDSFDKDFIDSVLQSIAEESLIVKSVPAEIKIANGKIVK